MCWDNFSYLIPSVYNVSLNEKSESALNLDLKNTAGAKKITYSGTAEIGPQIIEGGLEVPTIIHKMPEAVLQLESFEAEIRPYIKKIFLD